MNTIKSKKLKVCTTKTRTITGFEDKLTPIYGLNFKELEYSKPLSKETIIIQEEIELDNGLFITIRNGIEQCTTNYKIINILESTNPKKGYQFILWYNKDFTIVEEPLFLGGVTNKNVKISYTKDNQVIKTSYDINIKLKDRLGHNILIGKGE